MAKHALDPSETECKLRILDLIRSSDLSEDNSVKHKNKGKFSKRTRFRISSPVFLVKVR